MTKQEVYERRQRTRVVADRLSNELGWVEGTHYVLTGSHIYLRIPAGNIYVGVALIMPHTSNIYSAPLPIMLSEEQKFLVFEIK